MPLKIFVLFLLGSSLEIISKKNFFICNVNYFTIFKIFFFNRQDNTVEVSRKNGIPSYLKFNSNSLLMSFVSTLDGYYRLSIKWTFNLCGDAVTPSLEYLHRLKCHGPVG